MQTWNKILTTTAAGVLATVSLLAGIAKANIAIQPAFVEVNMDAGRPSGVFMVANLGEKEERFRVNAMHFTYTEKGGLIKSKTGEHSLAPWIRFNPRELTLAPKTQRAVRFAVVPRGPLSEGEWWAAMELESLTVNEMVSKTDDKGRSMKLKAITCILTPIFATVGKTSYEGEIKDVKVQVEGESVLLATLISATGNGRLGIIGSYEVLDASGTPVSSGSLGNAYVLRGTQRWLTKKIEGGIPNGQYTVKVSLKETHMETPLTSEALVTWPELPPAETKAAALPAAAQPAPAN